MSTYMLKCATVATLSSFLDFNFEKYHLIKTITQNNAAIMVVRVAI